jgi:RNA polymerase sigma factor (sigma-70 family)
LPSAPRDRSDDESLLRRFLTGERAAHDTVAAWASEVVRSRHYRVSPDDAADLVQATVTAVWIAAARDGFALTTGLRPFVHHVAMARCVDWIRRRRATVPVEDWLPDPGPPPDHELARAQELSMLRRALDRLKPFCRELIREHFQAGRTYGSIAADTGHAEATLRVHMHNCIRSLRSLYLSGHN